MGRSRRADAVVFGFDFQVNAAIILFIENVKNVKTLRLEGNYEDIEIEMDNGEYILAQAKAVQRASDDFANVRANMKKAITTLSEGSHKTKVKELIMVTNYLTHLMMIQKVHFMALLKGFIRICRNLQRK